MYFPKPLATLVFATLVVLATPRLDAGAVPGQPPTDLGPLAFDAIAMNSSATTADGVLDSEWSGNTSATGGAVAEGECCGGSTAFQAGLATARTPAPEPTTLLLLGLGLAVLAWSIKRGRRK